ncbi:MAG: tryptophan synthase subunit alpha, partial [Chloroflexota bacterium]
MTFGDPDPATSVAIVKAVANAGADIVELGVPFSDPSADGPVIQAAMERALRRGATLTGALDLVERVRREGLLVPLVLFGYYNPLYVYAGGLAAFCTRARDAGVDGLLVVDLPVDEMGELAAPASQAGLELVPFLAPTSTD